ncbi:hypothetical protein D3C85_1946450 [compost metagenome]
MAITGYAAYSAKPLMLFVVAMFGGSYQYDKDFFFLIAGSIVVTALVLSTIMDHLIFDKKVENSA